MSEIWKDVPNFESLYQVSDLGNVRSFVPSNKHFGKPWHLLTPSLSNSGYYNVTLYAKDGKRKKFLVHRLVAEAFVPNPQNLPCVNHRDENKENNAAANLEWCTYQYNNAYGTARIRAVASSSRKVNQYTVDGVWLASYLSVGVASKLLNVSAGSIKGCLSGDADFAHGYKWKYD